MRRFEKLQREAKRRGIILERINRVYDGDKYRYEATDNAHGITGVYKTINEAAVEILNDHQGGPVSALAIF